MVIRLGLLGQGIEHSLSPRLHQALGRWAGVPVEYELFDVAPADLEDALATLRARQLAGFNVTAPYKSDLLAHVTGRTPTADRAGALNTICVRHDGSWLGANTDVAGLAACLRSYGALQRVVLLGAGGAARAAACALADWQTTELCVVNRSAERGHRIVEDIWSGRGVAESWNDMSQRLVATDLVVNTLPPAARPSLAMHLPSTVSSEARWLDLSYGSSMRPWLDDLQSRGFVSEDGMRLLIYQGVTSFALWTKRKAPFSVGLAAFKNVIGSHTIDR